MSVSHDGGDSTEAPRPDLAETVGHVLVPLVQEDPRHARIAAADLLDILTGGGQVLVDLPFDELRPGSRARGPRRTGGAPAP